MSTIYKFKSCDKSDITLLNLDIAKIEYGNKRRLLHHLDTVPIKYCGKTLELTFNNLTLLFLNDMGMDEIKNRYQVCCQFGDENMELQINQIMDELKNNLIDTIYENNYIQHKRKKITKEVLEVIFLMSCYFKQRSLRHINGYEDHYKVKYPDYFRFGLIIPGSFTLLLKNGKNIVCNSEEINQYLKHGTKLKIKAEPKIYIRSSIIFKFQITQIQLLE